MTEEGTSTDARRRGRRPHSVAESSRVRERILAAFTEEFAHTGYHGLTVALVLDRAGISRGTFYRYFRDLDEPMGAMLDRKTGRLIEMVGTPLRDGELPMAKITGAVDGYLEWGRQERAILRSLHAGLHDPSNPVSAARIRIMGVIADLLRETFAGFGLTPPEADTLQVFLNALEFVVYQHYLTHDPDDGDALVRTRETMFKMAVALLTPPSQWSAAAEVLDIKD